MKKIDGSRPFSIKHIPIPYPLKMFRALKFMNGGEQVEYKHFNTLSQAYAWLTPNNQAQEEERWHIKMLPAVRREFEEWNLNIITIGWNEMNDDREETRYIQRVEMWNDNLPRF